MLFKSSDKNQSYQLVFDTQSLKIGQRYSTIKDVVALFQYFKLQISEFNLREFAGQYFIIDEDELLRISRCVLAMALLREKHTGFVKFKTRKEQERNKEAIRNKEKTNNLNLIPPGPSPKIDPLNLAIKQQYEKDLITIHQDKAVKLIEDISKIKFNSKIKTKDEISRDVDDELSMLIGMTDWMRPNNLTALEVWLDVQIDVFDQALNEDVYSDFDDLTCHIYLAKKGHETVKYITTASKTGFDVLPKNLQKLGFEFGGKQ